VEEVSIIGLDLAKDVFQAHGASASGAAVFRKKLRREQVLTFFAGQPRVKDAIRAAAASVLYLPPHSPDLNPIEQLAKLKATLRSAASRTKDALWATIGQALDASPKPNVATTLPIVVTSSPESNPL
jgi:transposase